MTIQTVFTLNTPGGPVRLFANGTAIAENWCAEFSDWHIEHIEIENIFDADGDDWPIGTFSLVQIAEIRRGLLIAARQKSAMNPTLAANLRNLLNLPPFDAKPDYI